MCEGEKKFTRENCITLLREKYTELRESEEQRYPKRSDFSEREVVAIKAHLGPWPRALEAAGIKEERSDDIVEKNREKRIRAKKNRISALKESVKKKEK